MAHKYSRRTALKIGAGTLAAAAIGAPSVLRAAGYPDRPINQQPAPGDCTALRDNIPAGAYLIRT